MRTRMTLFGMLIVLGTVLAACAPASGSAAGEPTVAAPVAIATQAPAAPSSSGNGYGYGYGSSSPATQPAAMAGAIAVADSAKGKILVDGNGMTLYIYTRDSANTSNCTGACAKNWPALPAVSAANIGAGVDATLVGSITRSDGTTQATYKGMPLYTYASDMKPGDLNGQGKGGVWYVISPTGDIINP